MLNAAIWSTFQNQIAIKYLEISFTIGDIIMHEYAYVML